MPPRPVPWPPWALRAARRPPAAEGGTKTADTGAAAATSWRDKPEMPTEFVETVDADIVVVGAGNGGLVAATTAAQNGAKVVVLEKAGAIAAAREAIGGSAEQWARTISVYQKKENP